jgi:hypothetical protein
LFYYYRRAKLGASQMSGHIERSSRFCCPRARAFLVAWLVCVAGHQFRSAIAGMPPEVERSWRDRQERVRSFRFTWTRRFFEPTEIPAARGAPGAAPRIFRLTDKATLTVDGRRMRYVLDGQRHGALGTTQIRTRVRTAVYDGSIHTKVERVPSRLEDSTFVQAVISSENPDVHSDMLALLLAFRMLDKGMQPTYDLTSFQLAPETPQLNGRPMIVLTSDRTRMWIDPQRDHAIVRILLYHPGTERIQTQANLDYRLDARHGWLPDYWEWTRFTRDGQWRMTSRSEVRACEINPSVPESTFQVEIPADALILDQRDPENLVTRIQRPGGKSVRVDARRPYSKILDQVRREERAAAPPREAQGPASP